MRPALLGVMLLSVTTPISVAQDKSSSELEGIWKLIAVERGGEPEPLSEPPRFVWVIKNSRIIYGGQEYAVLKLDTGVTPRTSDLEFSKSTKVLEGIYKLDDTMLKLCINRQSDGIRERPGEFSTKDKENWTLLTFERLPAGENPTEGLGAFVGVALGINKERKEIYVVNTIPGSPAEKAGLKKDDIVLQVGSLEATALVPTVNAVRRLRPGTEVSFRIRRAEREQTILIKAALLPFLFLD